MSLEVELKEMDAKIFLLCVDKIPTCFVIS